MNYILNIESEFVKKILSKLLTGIIRSKIGANRNFRLSINDARVFECGDNSVRIHLDADMDIDQGDFEKIIKKIGGQS